MWAQGEAQVEKTKELSTQTGVSCGAEATFEEPAHGVLRTTPRAPTFSNPNDVWNSGLWALQ